MIFYLNSWERMTLIRNETYHGINDLQRGKLKESASCYFRGAKPGKRYSGFHPNFWASEHHFQHNAALLGKWQHHASGWLRDGAGMSGCQLK